MVRMTTRMTNNENEEEEEERAYAYQEQEKTFSRHKFSFVLKITAGLFARKHSGSIWMVSSKSQSCVSYIARKFGKHIQITTNFSSSMAKSAILFCTFCDFFAVFFLQI